jgi:ketol-acid reductoisomerase
MEISNSKQPVNPLILDNAVGNPEMQAAYTCQAEHGIEKVGGELRAMMPWIARNKLVDKAVN